MLRWNQRIFAAFRSQCRRPRIRLTSTKSDPKPPTAPNAASTPRSSDPAVFNWPPKISPLRLLIVAYGVVLAGHISVTYFVSMAPAYGVSMLPTMYSVGEWMVISKYYRRGRGVSVGDVVSFKHPLKAGEHAVKRIVGMEGDFVLMYTPGKNDTMIQVPEGHCWVAGDNLRWSRDSRMFGPLPLALIRGKVQAKFTIANWIPSITRIEHGLQPGVEDDLD